MDHVVFRYVEGVALCMGPGILSLLCPQTMLETMSPSSSQNELGHFVMRLWGLTCFGFGGMLALTYPKLGKSAKSHLLGILLLGDFMHLSTVSTHRDMFGG